MTPESFCYWLQGYFELAGPSATLTPAQVQVVRNHLALVFHHSIDPAQGLSPGQEVEVQAIHDGKPVFPRPDHMRPGVLYRC